MKQPSLFDSFKKCQKKNQEENQTVKSEVEHPQFMMENNEIKKNNKMTLDSDDEKSSVRNKIPHIQIDEEHNFEKKPNQVTSKRKHNNKKSEKQVKIEASDMEIENEKEGDEVKEEFIKSDTIKKKEEFEDEKAFLEQFSDATPIWAQKEYCKDKNMRKVNDPDYDPTTLYVPSEAWPKFSAPMKQFWSIKSENFDKIVCFKLGKFYELFYDDAAIGNRYLQLKYMGTKMHTGFPEKCLDRYANELLELGFKLVIVEQMETPAQMTERVAEDKKKGKKSEKTLNREVTQILTKGTYNKEESDAVYLPNYLLSLRSFGECFAFSLLEIGTNEITMDTVDSIDKLKTILYQTRPSEIVYEPDNLSFNLTRMMEMTFLNIQMSKIPNKNNLWHPLNAISEIERLDKEGKMKRGKIFELIDGLSEVNKNLLYSTLSGMFAYLKSVFRFEYVLGSVRFTFYQKEEHSKNMILDSQALQHLEIFETSVGVEGSLFKIIDRTKTKFGKRLLRKWLMSPLMNEYHINQRLNAIEDIENLGIEKEKIASKLKKMPDIDKRLNRLYHYAVKSTNASKAVYFADISTLRLKEFKEIMQNMEECCEVIEVFRQHNKKFKSTRLKQLTTIGNTVKINDDDVYEEDEDDQREFEGLLPDVLANLEEFKTYIKWEDNIPKPQKGLVAHFDELKDEEEMIKQELEKFIEGIRYEMNEPNLKFVHIKERYEIEVPEKSDKKKPKNFEFCSKKAGFSRYLCPTVKSIVKKLEKNEAEIKEQMALFIGFFFEEFKKKQKIWQRFIEIIAEIDCLISLSEYSFTNDKVRPIFIPNILSIKGAKHPCLTMIDFIPNDIIMKEKIMLLTGPNMGGKSTILRTVCLLAVLAQVGCYVPCIEYKCEIIDRVFTRIGASDKLELGKSTFFIEMEETKSVLEHATSKSLVIMDELGRGTSTFDGLSIAYAVLRNIIEDLNCYCLFATHYHILIDEFRLRPEVSLMKMDSILKEEEIIFLYKLVKGNVERSFGLSIASRVGMNQSILEVAEKEAEKMNLYMEGRRKSVLETVMKWLEN